MSGTQVDEVLEFGLLFIVTGLAMVVLVTILIAILSNEREVESSPVLIAISCLVVAGMGAAVFELVRRLRRFIALR